MKRGTHLPCQGHTARSVAEVGVNLGFSASKFRGHFPALVSSQAPSVASLRAGDLGVFSLVCCSDWASTVQLEGSKAASFIHPSLCRSLSDGRGRNSRAGGVSDQAGKRTKKLRGGRRWRGG